MRGYYPGAQSFEGRGSEPLWGRLLRPARAAIDAFLPRFRLLQRGQTHLYLLYVLIATIVLLAFAGLGVPL